jgi:hypothetical protein
MSGNDHANDHRSYRNEHRYRLSRLLGMHVVFADGRDGDQVTDVRLASSNSRGESMGALVVKGLIIGRRRPGTYFGYDRHPSMGPWILRIIIRALHRHTGYVTWDDVDHVDWKDRVVRLRVNELRPLSAH